MKAGRRGDPCLHHSSRPDKDRYITSLASALTANGTREVKRGPLRGRRIKRPGNIDTAKHKPGTHSKSRDSCQGPRTEEANKAG